MLVVANVLLTIFHVGIILFNLFGWIWERTRKIHLWVALATLLSWFVLGIKYGLGYCFLTDWHWDIKRQLGEKDLPNSFVQYLFEEMGFSISPLTTDYITVISFMVAILLSLYFNFWKNGKSSISIS